MKLYFSPLACSLSVRISLYEARSAGADVEPVEYVEVNTRTGHAADGSDYRLTHGLGLVPALRLAGGEVVSENAAILEYIAEAYPIARLAPVDLLGRTRLRQWLSFIGTELHKAVFTPLLAADAPEPVKQHALALAEPRLSLLAKQLDARAHLLDDFSVADAYLSTVLNWASVTRIELGRWPSIGAYLARVRARPAAARALADELELYRLRRSDPTNRAVRAAVPSTEEVIARFNAAFQNHDPSALPALIARDCILENTHPAPDGSRHKGREACVALWSSIASAPDLRFEQERVEVYGERATILWKLSRAGADPVRGVNLMRVREGEILEALGYVKG